MWLDLGHCAPVRDSLDGRCGLPNQAVPLGAPAPTVSLRPRSPFLRSALWYSQATLLAGNRHSAEIVGATVLTEYDLPLCDWLQRAAC